MKKSLLAVVLILAAVSALMGCHKKVKRLEPMFTSSDTTMVLELTQTYLDHVKNKEYDQAMAMLFDILADSVRELSPQRDSSIRQQQKVFPVLSYKLTDMQFTNPHRVRVTYTIEFFEKEEGSNIPNTIALTFEPQRIDGKWYLELSKRFYSR